MIEQFHLNGPTGSEETQNDYKFGASKAPESGGIDLVNLK